MPDAMPPGFDLGYELSDVAQLRSTLDALVEMAWEPGWAPAALVQLVMLCRRMRSELDPATWQAAWAGLLDHPVHRLMGEDPLVRVARDQAGQPQRMPALQDLLLRHEAAAPMLVDVSRAGRDLFEATTALGHFAALRAQSAFLARIVDAVLERQPGGEILSLGAGHLREAALLTRPGKLGRWVAQEADAGVLSTMRRGLPPGLPVRSLRCNLSYFVRRPYLRGCFDLILLPELPGCGTVAGLRSLVDSAFAALKPGGLLLLGSASAAPPEAAWMDVFLRLQPCWRTVEEMKALIAAAPPGESCRHRVFHSVEGRRLYAMVERRR